MPKLDLLDIDLEDQYELSGFERIINKRFADYEDEQRRETRREARQNKLEQRGHSIYDDL